MAFTRPKSPPAGVLEKPHPAQLKTANGKTVPDMFYTDTQRGILWLDARAGLGVIGAAAALMRIRMGGRSWQSRRAPAAQLAKIKKSPAFRQNAAIRIAA